MFMCVCVCVYIYIYISNTIQITDINGPIKRSHRLINVVNNCGRPTMYALHDTSV